MAASAPASPPSKQSSPRTRHIRSLSNTPLLSRFSKEGRARAASHNTLDHSLPDLHSQKEINDTTPTKAAVSGVCLDHAEKEQGLLWAILCCSLLSS